MSDLIDRNVLKAKMYQEAFESDTDMQRWDSGCWIRYKLFENVVDSMPTVPYGPRWVRCEDEMPKSGTHVLVCCEVRGIGGYVGHYVCDAFHTDARTIPCQYSDDIDSEYDEETDEYYFPDGWWEVIKNWDDYSCVAISDFVTHWMPLPEPPKEGED